MFLILRDDARGDLLDNVIRDNRALKDTATVGDGRALWLNQQPAHSFYGSNGSETTRPGARLAIFP